MNFLKIDAKMSCQTSNTIITLPFPPPITASEIVNRRKPSRIKSKSPNAFLIYRKAFLDHLSGSHYNLRMTDVSRLVSKHWKNETEDVKDAYRKIAREVESELNEKRKKSDSYRVVWKNSKYSARKRIRSKDNNKSETTTKFKPTAVPPNRGNIFYQFVPTEFNKPPTKNDQKVVSPLESSNNSCYSPNSSNNSCYSPNSSNNSCYSPNSSNNSCYSPSSQTSEYFINYQDNNLTCLQFAEHHPHFVLDGDDQVDWYLRNLYNNNV